MSIGEKCSDCRQDLGHSWYFRVWVVVFLVTFIVSLVAMAEYAHRANQPAEAHGLRRFFTEQSSIKFPSFWIMAENFESTMGTMNITKLVCSHAGHFLSLPPMNDPRAQCVFGGFADHTRPSFHMPPNKCYALNNDLANIVASFPNSRDHSRAGFSQMALECTITTDITLENWNTSGSLDIGFQIYDPDPSKEFSFEGGDVARMPIFVPPYGQHSVLLTKRIIKWKGRTIDDWHRYLHMWNDANPTFFAPGYLQKNFTIIMDGNGVETLVEGDWFTGWQSAGQVGGFACLMWLVHKAFMFLVSLVLPNNSVFLHKG